MAMGRKTPVFSFDHTTPNETDPLKQTPNQNTLETVFVEL